MAKADVTMKVSPKDFNRIIRALEVARDQEKELFDSSTDSDDVATAGAEMQEYERLIRMLSGS